MIILGYGRFRLDVVINKRVLSSFDKLILGGEMGKILVFVVFLLVIQSDSKAEDYATGTSLISVTACQRMWNEKTEQYEGPVDCPEDVTNVTAVSTQEEIEACGGYPVIITGEDKDGIPTMISCHEWLQQQNKDAE